MASIRKAKKMGLYKPKYDKKLYQQTMNQIKGVNARLKKLEKQGYYGSWASKKLFNKLDNKNLYNVLEKTNKYYYNERTEKYERVVKSIKLSRNKNLRNTDLIAINKATKNFLNSQTSTIKGIKEVEEQTKDEMYKTFKLQPDTNISREDIEDMYDMLGDDAFRFFADSVGASTLWFLINTAIDKNMDEESFIDMLERYATDVNFQDLDVQDKARRLYEKYVIV